MIALTFGIVIGTAIAVAVDIVKTKPFLTEEEDFQSGFDLSVIDEALKNISPSHGLIKEI